MKILTCISQSIILLCLLFFFTHCVEHARNNKGPNDHTDSLKTVLQDDKPENKDVQKMEWWKEAKFGMFIHWGLFSELAGEWKGRPIPEGRAHDAAQIDLIFKIPNAEYEQTAKAFYPRHFDADEWVTMLKDAGMKYMVITAKHQEGFSMFKTRYSGYNVVDATPFGRDPIRELSAACRKAGIKFGVYYSDARDYHEPGASWNNYGNTWDFPPQTEEDFKAYFYGKVFNQVRELLTNYGKIAVIWFDVPYKLTDKMSSDLRKLVLSIQPDCIINNRIGNGYGDYNDFGDNQIPGRPVDTPWETCMTMNNTWGYSRWDHHFKSPEALLDTLVDIVSKGGNLLLNVGPDGQGLFPDESKKILEVMGNWLKANGASIYGAQRSPFPEQHKGWRCTSKPGYLYFHILEWPGEKLIITGLKTSVARAYFLANGKSIQFEQAGDQLIFHLPATPVNMLPVIAVELKGSNS